MINKRITIYDLSKELGISVSYISKALNNQPGVSERVRALVLQKAEELNYKHNTHAANLRRGSSRTLGVIVPHINQGFFSDTISGIERACAENNHSLIICQSHDNFSKEKTAIETLIHQNVDCILLSASIETSNAVSLEQILKHNIHLIQFDRCIEMIDSHKVENDNQEAAYKAVKSLIEEGYKKIAFIGGPSHLNIYRQRKEGFLKAIKEASLPIPYNFIVEETLEKQLAFEIATELLSLNDAPDAFFTISDIQALGVKQAIEKAGLRVSNDIGLFGFANEPFTELIEPPISSIDQKGEELGYQAAKVYFDELLKKTDKKEQSKKIIACELKIRKSSKRD
ncbi:LacI family DNA-binding transcriptional regulator [Desertivirga arenae]|uniref:LacI family DNA-binding transcriptional regulator n=1 Tax=Desertivirga arenae TaxID=2810309 RepID=UPI001A959C59|nr:LacI family DNA-binding transcriptional regulator [Pedobacter sp. SYSU D00823]